MKCVKCEGMWQGKSKLANCPFCGERILSGILKSLVEQNGPGLLEGEERIYSFWEIPAQDEEAQDEQDNLTECSVKLDEETAKEAANIALSRLNGNKVDLTLKMAGVLLQIAEANGSEVAKQYLANKRRREEKQQPRVQERTEREKQQSRAFEQAEQETHQKVPEPVQREKLPVGAPEQMTMGKLKNEALVWNVLESMDLGDGLCAKLLLLSHPVFCLSYLENPEVIVNSDFLANAFSEPERRRILRSPGKKSNNSVFLLSRAQARQYLEKNLEKLVDDDTRYIDVAARADGMWLREDKDVERITAPTLHFDRRIYEMNRGEKLYIYPAIWVECDG